MKRVLRFTVLACLMTVFVLTLKTSQVRAAEERKLSLNATKITIYVDNNYQLELLNRLTKEKVTFKSSDKSIAKVTADGMITGVKKGSATITATCNGKKYKCAVTVKAKKSAGNVVYSGNTFGEDDEYVYYLDIEGVTPKDRTWGYLSGGYLCKARKDGKGEPQILMKDCCYKPMLVDDYIYYLYCWSTLYYDLNKFYWCCRIKTDGTGGEVLTGKEYSVYDYTVYDGVLYCSLTDDDYRVNGNWIPVKTGIYSINLSNKKMTYLSPRESTVARDIIIANGRLYYSDRAVLNHLKNDTLGREYLFSMNLDGTCEKIHDRVINNYNEYYTNFAQCGGYMYYVDFDNYLSRIKLDGTGEPEKLHKVYGALAVKGDWIYAADYAKDKFGTLESGGIIRVNSKTKAVEKILDGIYYPDHVYGNKLYLSTSNCFAFGDLSVYGYNGSKWNMFTEKIDFATLGKIKNIKTLPDKLETGAVAVTPVNSARSDHDFDIGTSVPGGPSYVYITSSDLSGGSGLKMKVGDTRTINVGGRSTKAHITYKVKDSKIASVNKDGVVTALKGGETSITVVYNYNLTFKIRVRIAKTQEEYSALLMEKDQKYSDKDDLKTKIGNYEWVYDLDDTFAKRLIIITDPTFFSTCINGKDGDTSDGKKAVADSDTPLSCRISDSFFKNNDGDTVYSIMELGNCNYMCPAKIEEGADILFLEYEHCPDDEIFCIEAEDDLYLIRISESNLYIYNDNGALKLTASKGKALRVAIVSIGY